ncbi:MAG: cytochrome c biogenesis CcdA family protein [Haloarculaceae archaeon]
MTAAPFLGTLAFAVGAGVTTFFAPCAFPLLPGYVGYYVKQSEAETPGLLSAGAAAAGSLLALGAVASLAFALGRTLTSVLPVVEPVVGAGMVGFGLLVVLDRAPSVTLALPERPESVVGFGAFGAVYALAAAGCVAPLFLGVLAQALTFSVVGGAVVLASYAAAVAVPLVGVTLLASAGVESWHALGRYGGRAKQVAGVVMIAAGVGQLYLSIVVLGVV